MTRCRPWPPARDARARPVPAAHGLRASRARPRRSRARCSERIAARPDGARAARAHGGARRRARRAGRPPSRLALALLCVAVYALQLALRPHVYDGGVLERARSCALGEPWRLVTANLLHAKAAAAPPAAESAGRARACSARWLERAARLARAPGRGDAWRGPRARWRRARAGRLRAGGRRLGPRLRASRARCSGSSCAQPEALPAWLAPPAAPLRSRCSRSSVVLLFVVPGVAHGGRTRAASSAAPAAAATAPGSTRAARRLGAARSAARGRRSRSSRARRSAGCGGVLAPGDVRRAPPRRVLARRCRGVPPPAEQRGLAYRDRRPSPPRRARRRAAHGGARGATRRIAAEPDLLDTLAEVHFLLGRSRAAVELDRRGDRARAGRALLHRAAPPLPRRARAADDRPDPPRSRRRTRRRRRRRAARRRRARRPSGCDVVPVRGDVDAPAEASLDHAS